jgi:hypothetical protein
MTASPACSFATTGKQNRMSGWAAYLAVNRIHKAGFVAILLSR